MQRMSMPVAPHSLHDEKIPKIILKIFGKIRVRVEHTPFGQNPVRKDKFSASSSKNFSNFRETPLAATAQSGKRLVGARSTTYYLNVLSLGAGKNQNGFA